MLASFRRRKKRPATRYARPRVEILEARRVLATFIVGTVVDNSGGTCEPDAPGNDTCSIRDAIVAAQMNPGPDRIEIPAGTYTLTQGSLDVDQPGDISFVGTGTSANDVVIDGDSATRIFDLFASDVTSNISFTSLTIQNGVAGDTSGGGGINAGPDVNLVLEDVVLNNNSAPEVLNPVGGNLVVSGGAIQASGNVTISNSSFTDNSASSAGGAIDFVAATATTRLSISSTIFSTNQAMLTAGAIRGDGGVVVLDNVNFIANAAGDSAGGAFLTDLESVTVNNSDFFRNVARGDNNSDGISGGLYIQNARNSTGDGVIVTNTQFRENQAFDSGAGMTILNSNSSITDTDFLDNVVTGSGVTFDTGGGGLSVQDDVSTTGSISFTQLLRVNIRGNSAPAGGGISVVNAVINITDSDISNNTATEAATGGGGIGVIRGIARATANALDINIANSTISNNTTAGGGGGIGGIDASVLIDNSTLDGNAANGSVGGGGIGLVGVSFDPVLIIQRSTISNNSAVGSGGGVGVVDANVTITEVTLDMNRANGGVGGGIAVLSQGLTPNLSVTRSTISRNSATEDGGGIAVMNGGFSLSNVTITNNNANGNGGGLAYDNSNTSISGGIEFSTIASNSVQSFGSNVAVASSVVRFLSTIIADPLGVAPAFNFVSFPGTISSQGFNIVSDNSSSFAAQSDQVNTNPLIGPLADNGGPVQTRALLTGSPGIDAGAGTPLTTDARGRTRPVDGNGDGAARNDIGAFEAQSTAANLSLGNLVFRDSTNNGIFDGNDTPISSVSLTLFRDNGDGVLDVAVDTLVGSTTSDASGIYQFTGLIAGDYFVLIDGSNFTDAGALFGLSTSTGNDPAPDPDNNVDNDDNGVVFAGGVASSAITLSVGGEPTGGNSNNTLDFGFTAASPPITANDDQASTNEDTAVTIDVLFNDIGAQLTLTSVSTSANGTVSIVNNQASFVPNADFFGSTSFTYVATDANGQTASALVSVDVVSVNDAPLAADDSINIPNSSPFTISQSSLTANDLAGPGSESSESVSIVSVTQPSAGTVVLNSLDILYTAPSGFVGTTSFTYTIHDDAGLADTATVTLNVGAATMTRATLSTGSGDGNLTVTVDGYGAFGSSQLSPSAPALFDPIGSINSASTVFRSFNSFRNATTGGRQNLSTGSFPGIAVQSNSTRATSSFTIDGFRFDLVQEVQPQLNDAGLRIGARLNQTYTITNIGASNSTFDVARYVDGDLFFDGSLIDGGGFLIQPDGTMVLFETDRGGSGSTDTTFVGISSSGGVTPTSDQFDIDGFSVLRSRVESGSALRNLVTNDRDGNGFVDNGSEYDVALALRRVLNIPQGQSGTYETTTFFGQRPDQIVPQDPGLLSGHVYCDINGNLTEDTGEASVDATVFVDTNGNRLQDSGELVTLTDSLGNFTFASVPGGQRTVALVVPNGCHALPQEFGSVTLSTRINAFANDLQAADVDGDLLDDVLIVTEQPNQLLLLRNSGTDFVQGGSVQLDDRPQAVKYWRPSQGSGGVIAVAALGSKPVDGRPNVGSVFVIQADTINSQTPTIERLAMGDGPIDVAIDDFNQDGLPDYVSAATRSSDFFLMLSGSTQPVRLTGLDSAIRVTTGDFDNDGNRDIAIAGYGGIDFDTRERRVGQIQVLFGNGQGGFDRTSQIETFVEPIALGARQLNALGGDELVVLGYRGDVAVFDFNSSIVMNRIGSETLSKGTSRFEIGDVNRDGLLDIAVVNGSNETVSFLIGDGTGAVTLKKEMDASTSSLGSLSSKRGPVDLAFGRFGSSVPDGLLIANRYQESSGGGLVTPGSTTFVRLNVDQQNVLIQATNPRVANFNPSLPRTRLDVNLDNQVSAGDALEVIATMNRLAAEGEHRSGVLIIDDSADVDGNGSVTAADALMIINYLNTQSMHQQAEPESANAFSPSFAASLPISVKSLDDDRDELSELIDLLIEDQLRLA